MQTPHAEVRIEALRCAELANPGYDEIECGRLAEHECSACGEGLCIRCTDPCYQCAEHLHTHCREEHAKASGHAVDAPPGPPRYIRQEGTL